MRSALPQAHTRVSQRRNRSAIKSLCKQLPHPTAAAACVRACVRACVCVCVSVSVSVCMSVSVSLCLCLSVSSPPLPLSYLSLFSPQSRDCECSERDPKRKPKVLTQRRAPHGPRHLSTRQTRKQVGNRSSVCVCVCVCVCERVQEYIRCLKNGCVCVRVCWNESKCRVRWSHLLQVDGDKDGSCSHSSKASLRCHPVMEKEKKIKEKKRKEKKRKLKEKEKEKEKEKKNHTHTHT